MLKWFGTSLFIISHEAERFIAETDLEFSTLEAGSWTARFLLSVSEIME